MSELYGSVLASSDTANTKKARPRGEEGAGGEGPGALAGSGPARRPRPHCAPHSRRVPWGSAPHAAERRDDQCCTEPVSQSVGSSVGRQGADGPEQTHPSPPHCPGLTPHPALQRQGERSHAEGLPVQRCPRRNGANVPRSPPFVPGGRSPVVGGAGPGTAAWPPRHGHRGTATAARPPPHGHRLMSLSLLLQVTAWCAHVFHVRYIKYNTAMRCTFPRQPSCHFRLTHSLLRKNAALGIYKAFQLNGHKSQVSFKPNNHWP